MAKRLGRDELAAMYPEATVKPPAGMTPIALIAQTEFAAQTRDIPVDDVVRSPYQPRLALDPEHVESLAESIRSTRQIEPILVRQLPDGKFELLAGENRLRAIRLLGRDTILATIRQVSDSEAQVITLVDNLKRQGLSDYEAGRGFARLLAEKIVVSVSDLAAKVGISRGNVYRCLKLAELPTAITDLLDKNPCAIGGNAGDILRSLIDEGYEALAIQAAERVVQKKLNQNEIERWVLAQAKAARKGDGEDSNGSTTLEAFRCGHDAVRARVILKGRTLRADFEVDKALPAQALERVRQVVEETLRSMKLDHPLVDTAK